MQSLAVLAFDPSSAVLAYVDPAVLASVSIRMLLQTLALTSLPLVEQHHQWHVRSSSANISTSVELGQVHGPSHGRLKSIFNKDNDLEGRFKILAMHVAVYSRAVWEQSSDKVVALFEDNIEISDNVHAVCFCSMVMTICKAYLSCSLQFSKGHCGGMVGISWCSCSHTFLAWQWGHISHPLNHSSKPFWHVSWSF